LRARLTRLFETISVMDNQNGLVSTRIRSFPCEV
jgi:hypothetical protein